MKAESILTTLFAILAVFGIVLVYLSAGGDEVIEVVVGMGAVILGVLGLEAREIAGALRESQEVK